LDELSSKIKNPTVIVMDNAPWHRAAKVRSKEQQWNEKGLFLFFLPTYSPHLNLIEILWREIKYRWLKAEDYLSAKSLKEAIHYIITKYDDEFSINFSMNLFS
jgi:transposase